MCTVVFDGLAFVAIVSDTQSHLSESTFGFPSNFDNRKRKLLSEAMLLNFESILHLKALSVFSSHLCLTLQFPSTFVSKFKQRFIDK